MASNLENRYVLERDEAESQRLDRQHFIYKANVGYLVHPSIPTPSQNDCHKDFHVADVGAGTGIWLLDLSQSLPPSSHLSAFDISPAQFDLNRSLPSNITFTQHDLLKPFPQSHLGKYDVVHVRLMCFVLSKDEWTPAVKNIMTLLKPGGHLQWVDASLANAKIYLSDESTVIVYAHRCREIIERAFSAMNKDLGSTDRLLSIFQSCGLAGCIEERIASDRDPSMRADFNSNLIVTFESVGRNLVAAGGVEGLENKEEVHKLSEGLRKELADPKVIWRQEIVVVVGRKPLT